MSDGSNATRGKLFAAAWRGQDADLREILDKSPDLIDAQDENGVTALRFTAQFGHTDMTRFLLDKGAAIDLKAKDGITPLLAAVQHGHLEVANDFQYKLE